MGVRGLTKYISNNSKLYLKPHKLRDCYLVIDGNNLAAHLYLWLKKSDSIFGGDYDEYYNIILNFFTNLRRCNVIPIVLFDGGYEPRKLKTILSRAVQKLPILRRFARGYSPADFFPLFMKDTFFDVMNDLNISCIQCDFEADIEIATVARTLNCPVLSYDSDFYIYDVLYIPFDSVCATPDKDSDNKYFINCYIYEVTNFLSNFSGLDKSLLPIMATLLGNDYIESVIFQKFFQHVSMPSNKNMSYSQMKIHGVLHWLKKENVKSATSRILSHLEKKNAKQVLDAINTTIEDYTTSFVSDYIVTEIDRITKQSSSINLSRKSATVNLPSEILKLFQQCKIHKHIIDMVTLHTYYTQLQVENVFKESAHWQSLPLIQSMYTLLNPYVKHQGMPLKVYLAFNNRYSHVKVKTDSSTFSLGDILSQPKEVRLKVLCDIVGVDESEINSITSNSTWSVFIMSYIYWMNKLNNSISFTHIHALVLMVIANQIVQKSLGYYGTVSKFQKKYKALIEQIKPTDLVAKERKDFNEMLADVPQEECILMQSSLIPFRQKLEKENTNCYSISIVQPFNCFQSILFHIMQLNALLNYPLPSVRISDFYSGTLLFNLYINIKAKGGLGRFGENLLKNTPTLSNIYNYLSEKLCAFSMKTPVVRKPRKKNRRNKKSVKEICDEIIVSCEEDDGEEYYDSSNPYYLLQRS